MARPPRRTAGPPSTERKIYFYRAHAGLLASGKPVPIPFQRILDEVAAQPCAAGGRYWEQPDGNVVCGWPDDGLNHPAMRLATVRRSGLPLLEDAGTLSELTLPATAGLYEAVHVIFFSEGIVGVEFNFYGPRPSRLPRYLQRVARNRCPTFTLDPLLRQDVAEQLRKLQRIRKFDFKVRGSYVDTVARADRDLGNALRACRDVGQSEVVHLILQPAPHARTWLTPRLLVTTRRLARRGDLRENAYSFQVRGRAEEGRMETVDVLHDELVSAKRIVLIDHRSRAVNDAAAYRAIEEAYGELRPQLEAAAAVTQ